MQLNKDHIASNECIVVRHGGHVEVNPFSNIMQCYGQVQDCLGLSDVISFERKMTLLTLDYIYSKQHAS